MKLVLASISSRKSGSKSEPAESLVRDYLTRCLRLCPTEAAVFPTEAALLASAARQPGRPPATLLLFDSAGELLTSEEFAQTLGRLRDQGAARLLFGIGPHDGWSPAARQAAARTVSFGRLTLPHELARVLAAEQIYRALTLLAGHPYHSGH